MQIAVQLIVALDRVYFCCSEFTEFIHWSRQWKETDGI